MSVRAGRSRLQMLTKDLVVHWQQTRETWKDAKGAEFEKKYMDELVANVNRVVTDLEGLEKMIA